jgi:DNA invertase Pin-like site-specific DNA recombinase
VIVIEYFEDIGVGGASCIDERPGLLAALSAVKRYQANLVILRRDRLARDVLTAATLDKLVGDCQSQILSVEGCGNGTTPSDDFMRSILDATAAFERALIRARTRAALDVKRQRGEATSSNPPYGFRVSGDGKTLEPHPEEQPAIFELRAMRARGMSFRAIQREATSRGLFGRTGRPFTLQAIFHVLSRSEPILPAAV